MQLFAQTYPKAVKGLVLVDSTSRDEDMKSRALPLKDTRYYGEAKGMQASVEQVKQAPAFLNTPLMVISSTARGENWLTLQKTLTQLSSNS